MDFALLKSPGKKEIIKELRVKIVILAQMITIDFFVSNDSVSESIK